MNQYHQIFHNYKMNHGKLNNLNQRNESEKINLVSILGLFFALLGTLNIQVILSIGG